jgi:hypothetical protein
MDHTLSNKWWEIVFKVTQDLDEGKVPYSFDASTSLFVHGIEDFEMDDLDIMVQWDYFEVAYKLFQQYNPSPINKGGFWQFNFFIDGLEVHIMSSEHITNLKSDNERVAIRKENRIIWSKSILFYRRHTTNLSLITLIDTFYNQTNND